MEKVIYRLLSITFTDISFKPTAQCNTMNKSKI